MQYNCDLLGTYNKINTASVIANDSDESSEFAHAVEPVIYYGDKNVNIGQPFEITCIIPITEKIHWTKNGESITRHNLRHGHDEHSYALSETAIEGEKHKIEAQLKVRHALKVHEGHYQCNNNHRHATGSHMLHVHGKESSSTESGYQTIDEMTPSSPNEIFTNTWKEQQQQQSHKLHKQPIQHFPSSSGNASTDYGIGFGYAPPAPTSKYNDLTTPWHTSSSSASAGNGIHRIYSATPPDFPPPRFSLMEHTVAPPEPPTIQLYNQTLPHHRQHTLDTATVTDSATATDSSATLLTTAHHHAHHQQQLQQQAQHTLNAYQLPLPPQPPHQSHTAIHRSDKYQTHSPQFIPPALGGGGGGVTVTPATTLLTTGYNSNHNNYYGQMQQQPKTFLPIKKGPDSLVPNYDNVELKMNFYKIRSPLVLSCDVKNTDSKDPLIWKKQGVNVTDVASLRGRFKIIHDERKFMIDKAEATDDGLYSCEFNGVTKNITAIARVFVRVPSNNGVVEGEKMVIHCTVTGSNPRLSWSFGNYVNLANSTERYILKPDENGVENALLMVENVTLDDRGDYKCTGRNEADDFLNDEVASDSTTVRVKGKFAALWPFLGICAEVLILCLIILIYEKRRNKSELEESDTDPQEQKKKRRNYD
ncbi:hypothetical protein ACLKA7_004139 [Drosophila subpalustris]